jgi:uncharacterized protein (TIGR03435 family)
MKRLLLCAAWAAVLMGGALRAQDVAGSWQGTLHAAKDLRVVVKISKDGAGGSAGLKAVVYSVDQGGQPMDASSITVDGTNSGGTNPGGATVKFAVASIGGSYAGTLSADGKTITGEWAQGGGPLPLVLVRATAETAWAIPTPAAPPKLMAANADPSFETATITPNLSGGTGMEQLVVDGARFAVQNGSLDDLIAYAYDVQRKQIVGGPEWMDKDRYNIAATIGQEGIPSPQQLRTMIRKLLASRFKLALHHDKREMDAYVLTTASGGAKLTAAKETGPLPGIGFRPGTGGVALGVQNGTVAEFAGFLQSIVLDRPVVDRTGVTGRFDFTVTFTPDASEFNGHAPKLPPRPATVAAAPSLTDALAQQLGLTMSAEKTAVDAIVVDRAEKPGAN